MMDRRLFLGALGGGIALAPTATLSNPPAGFGLSDVEDIAAKRASKPDAPRKITLPQSLAELDYDGHRKIRFNSDKQLWAEDEGAFTFDVLHPGWLFKDALDINVIENGEARSMPFDASLFEYPGEPPKDVSGMSYSGFRMRYPLNTPYYRDEFLVFQGASYFRAVGRDELYGLSARGLAIGTASDEGEEFPRFTAFWLERPLPNAKSIKIYALLESASVTGAYEFVATPGDSTVVEVRCTLYPRQDLETVGVAPLTSMFWFDPSDDDGITDFRGAVHDSDGLAIHNGAGERLWRPLSNPTTLQVSAFLDGMPKGFGLAQRHRNFEYYQDAQARYEKRPSAWVEPMGDWGAGAVILVEIPTKTEFNDNIVAFWRPREPLKAGQPHRFAYRLRWSGEPDAPADGARIIGTRSGHAPNDELMRFVVDFEGNPKLLETAKPRVSASSGTVSDPVFGPLPKPGTFRAAFAFEPEGRATAELRLQLVTDAGAPAGETWLYRWTAP